MKEQDLAIKIENLSKQYRLGVIGTGTLSHDLKRWWVTNILRKEDPYLKIGEVNNRANKGNSEYVWALKDINLEIKRGDVVGIIGRNGAGKSTLLKILSRVTKPSTGNIKYNGRIASLLEVGTGFHPEMTGRENIYMNGAIMGMTKAEITRKLDEIIVFAGVERYIDTPVKRYSSGMTVRLGFSIAAHLEPDILVVDEVLAVGDAEFQKKAIGKMQDVSKGGERTVLFVSHNMASVQNLCNKGVLLNNGSIEFVGDVMKTIDEYLKFNNPSAQKISEIKNRSGNGKVMFIDAEVIGSMQNNIIETFKDFFIRIKLDKTINLFDFQIDIGINNKQGDRVAWLSNSIIKTSQKTHTNEFCFHVKNNPLAYGNYNCNLYIKNKDGVCDWLQNVVPFSIAEKDYYNSGKKIINNQGDILLDYNIKTKI